MKKNGFTLIELLAVIVIIGMISLIAIPNVVNLVEGTKKDTMIGDAKKLISLAKYQISINYEYRNSSGHTFYLADLNGDGDLEKDPDNEVYDDESYVRYEKVGNVVKYCVRLVGGRRQIGAGLDGCVYEDSLHSRNNVIDRVKED